jgi:hypothetical protein
MQTRLPHIKKCQNSNSFFSKKGRKTTMCFNIRVTIVLRNPFLCLYQTSFYQINDVRGVENWVDMTKTLVHFGVQAKM